MTLLFASAAEQVTTSFIRSTSPDPGYCGSAIIPRSVMSLSILPFAFESLKLATVNAPVALNAGISGLPPAAASRSFNSRTDLLPCWYCPW